MGDWARYHVLGRSSTGIGHLHRALACASDCVLCTVYVLCMYCVLCKPGPRLAKLPGSYLTRTNLLRSFVVEGRVGGYGISLLIVVTVLYWTGKSFLAFKHYLLHITLAPSICLPVCLIYVFLPLKLFVITRLSILTLWLFAFLFWLA